MFSPLRLPGSPIQLQPSSLIVVGWVPRKFTSICDSPGALKNVCIRIPVDTPETAIVCDEQRVWHPRGRRKRMLVRVEGYTGGVTRPGGVRRHIGEAHAHVLRALDVAAIRAVSIAVNIIKLAVLR